MVPAMIIASAEDEVAPPADHAKLLYDSIGGSKTYVEFASGNHSFVSNSGEQKAALVVSFWLFSKTIWMAETIWKALTMEARS